MALGFLVALTRELTKIQTALGSVAERILVPTKTLTESGYVVASIQGHIKTPMAAGLSVVLIQVLIKTQTASGYALSRSNIPLQPTIKKLRFLPSAELAR